MFDLERAIAEWRQRMGGAGITSPETLEELAGHLREEMGRRMAAGEAEEVAFNLASEGLGEATALRAEFKKIEEGRWSRPLAYTAWGIFVVSFFLPAFDTGAGWRCAGLSASIWFDWLLHKNEIWSDYHLALLTLANMVMVGSPLLLRLSTRTGFAWNCVRAAAVGSILLVWSFLIRLACSDWQDLRFGAWVWGVSFVLLWVAMFKVSHRGMMPEQRPAN